MLDEARPSGIYAYSVIYKQEPVILTYSLDTDGMPMALARFMRRRGLPEEILSDNGSNFTAADHELHKALEQVEASRVTAEMIGHQVKWQFNLPATRTLVESSRPW